MFSLPSNTIEAEEFPEAGDIAIQSGRVVNCHEVSEHSTLKLSVKAEEEM